MAQLDGNKLNGLRTARELFDNKYGKEGTISRKEFNQQSTAWYYRDLLRDRRKQLGLTQQQLADAVGVKRSYIARVEKGETDVQLSSFLRIAMVLGIQLVPVLR